MDGVCMMYRRCLIFFLLLGNYPGWVLFFQDLCWLSWLGFPSMQSLRCRLGNIWGEGKGWGTRAVNQARQHCGALGLNCSGNPSALYSTCEWAAWGGWGISTPPPLGGWWLWIPCTELILGWPVGTRGRLSHWSPDLAAGMWAGILRGRA